MAVQIRIDKLKTIIRFPGHGGNLFPDAGSHAGMTLKAIREHVYSCTNELKPGAKWWKNSKGAMTHAKYPLTNLTTLNVVYGWSPKGKSTFATFQFNPSYLCQDAVTELHSAFMLMFYDGYNEFFNTAVIKEVEIALDVHGVQKESCL